MKTNAVRQPAHGRVSSHDIHEALIHSKKQAKPLTVPESFDSKGERPFDVRSGRRAVKHPYAAGKENAVRGEIPAALLHMTGPDGPISDTGIRSFPEKDPHSQYEMLKRGWVDFFLSRGRRK